jgi:hypothetical protein
VIVHSSMQTEVNIFNIELSLTDLASLYNSNIDFLVLLMTKNNGRIYIYIYKLNVSS